MSNEIKNIPRVDLKVGESVWLLMGRNNNKGSIREVTVTKIGKKYFYVDYSRNETKIEIGTKWTVGDFSLEVFYTKDSIEYHLKRCVLLNTIIPLFNIYQINAYSNEQLEKIIAICKDETVDSKEELTYEKCTSMLKDIESFIDDKIEKESFSESWKLVELIGFIGDIYDDNSFYTIDDGQL